jgi:hypothetical protein
MTLDAILTPSLLLGGTSTNVAKMTAVGLIMSIGVWILAALMNSLKEKLRKGKSMIRHAARELETTLKEATPKLTIISESDSLRRPAPGKWSRKEILGHLIDSASNNHQRFVRGQLSAEIRLGGYEQEKWVHSQNYQNEPWANLVTLWNSYNLHLAFLMELVPEGALKNVCFIGDAEPVTLEFLMTDYLRHLKHHLTQILGGW